MQLENAIQEAMAELDKVTESSKEEKVGGKSCKVSSGSKESGNASKQDGKRSSSKKASVGSVNPVAAEQKQCR